MNEKEEGAIVTTAIETTDERETDSSVDADSSSSDGAASVRSAKDEESEREVIPLIAEETLDVTDIERLSSETQSVLHPPSGKGSLVGSVFNLCNTTIGTGILTLPFALKMAGAVEGIMMIVLIGFFANVTLRYLVKCADRTGYYSYKELAILCFGRWAGTLVDFVIILYTTGTCVACPIIAGDILPQVFRRWFSESSVLCQEWFIILMSSLFIMFPLAAQRDIRKMSFASILAISCVAFLWLVVFEKFVSIYAYESTHMTLHYFNFDFGVVLALPLITAAFVSHYNALNIYRELSDRSYARMSIVVHSSTILSATVYSTFALFGYLSFRSETVSDVLRLYPDEDIYSTIARIMQSMTVFFSYPVVSFALRKGIDHFLFDRIDHSNAFPFRLEVGGSPVNVAVLEEEEEEETTTTPDIEEGSAENQLVIDDVGEGVGSPDVAIRPRRSTAGSRVRFLFWHLCHFRSGRLATESLILALFHGITAIIVGNLGVVLSFSGSLFGVSLVFLLPASFYWKLVVAPSQGGKALRVTGVIFVIVVGLFCMTTGFVVAVLHVFRVV